MQPKKKSKRQQIESMRISTIQNINNAHSTQEVNESKTNSIATIKSVQPNVIKNRL